MSDLTTFEKLELIGVVLGVTIAGGLIIYVIYKSEAFISDPISTVYDTVTGIVNPIVDRISVDTQDALNNWAFGPSMSEKTSK